MPSCGDDIERNGAVHPGAVSEIRKEAIQDTIPARAEGAEGVAHAPFSRRAEGEAARLARMRCEKAEAAAADALDQFHRRLGQYLDAAAWRAVVVERFCAIRAELASAFPALVETVRAAGDARRAALAASGWLRAVLAQIAEQCGDEDATKGLAA